MIDLTSLFSGLVGALVGTYFGARMIYYFSDKKNRAVRNIAVKALTIFNKYAKSNGKYNEATDEFNKILTLTEKRTVLVSLHKAGLPIAIPETGIINIAKVTFEEKAIDKELIFEMIGQIESGNCDNFFYQDPESYFSSDYRIRALRNLGKRFVKEVVSSSKKEKDTSNIIFSQDISTIFTSGELRTLQVIRQVLFFSDDYDNQGNFKKERINSLIKEIEMGLWDNYLLMPAETFYSLIAQNNLNTQVSQLFSVSLNNKPQGNATLSNNP